MKTVTENITNNDNSVQGNGWLNRTVAGAGITSALGDFCYETTTVILPGFLAVLGIPAAALGIIEGIADAVASFTKMVSGYIADKLGHRKLLVLVGYGLTPLGQALIALAAGWPLITTCAPSAASSCATQRPMPLPPPVTQQTRSSNRPGRKTLR